MRDQPAATKSAKDSWRIVRRACPLATDRAGPIIHIWGKFREMDDMRISWADVQKQFESVADQTLTEPVTITRNGRDRLVLMSVEEYDRLKRRDRRVVRLEDFTDEEMALVAQADVPADYACLDDELKDWQP
jgi:prevent-host-death family protein